MCIISWLIELTGTLFVVFSPLLQGFGIHNIHYPDCVIMYVIIPFVFLMNDEETKGIITEEGWYQGLRHMLGFYNQVMPIH